MALRSMLLSTLHLSALSLKSLGLIVEARRARRRAQKAFYQTLVSEGIDDRRAEDLADAYPDPVREILRFLLPARQK